MADGLRQHFGWLPTPPLRGSRIGEADPRGVAEQQALSLRPTPLPSPPPQGGRGEQTAPHATGLSVRHAFVAAASVLRDAGIETPELDARFMLCHAAGLSHEAYIARSGEAISPTAAARLSSYLERRVAREPVSRILGAREFYGRNFLVDRHTLDPRPDTETLIEAALECIDREGLRDRPLRILDLGTGTGCILITLLAELKLATAIGTDISEDVLALAAANAGRLGVAARASFIAGDWLDPVRQTFDLIVSNPPYIATAEIADLAPEVALHDPVLALDGGAGGLAAYRRIARDAAKALRPGGPVIVEIGADQADSVRAIFESAGLLVPEEGVWRDLGGRQRAVMARRGR
jgi:release factor glutamine methyltransferase